MTTLSGEHITTIKDASKKLTGFKRRAFQAQVAIDYLKSKSRLAERIFGWDRNTVELVPDILINREMTRQHTQSYNLMLDKFAPA